MSVSAPLRILVTRQNTYPARAYPVSTEGLASLRITDLIVKGLAELGHEVHYQVRLDQEPLPEGVRWVAEGSLPSVDIAHRQKVDLGVEIRSSAAMGQDLPYRSGRARPEPESGTG